MSENWAGLSADAHEKFLIMEDRASALFARYPNEPTDKQWRVHLFMFVDGKKHVYDNAKATADEAVYEAWQYYLEASKLPNVEWAQGIDWDGLAK